MADRSILGNVLLKALNDNQILVLSRVRQSSGLSITPILCTVSDQLSIPLSTLKLNARTLRTLGLIEFGSNLEPSEAKITAAGRLVLDIVSAARSGR